MSQHIDAVAKQSDIDALNSNIGLKSVTYAVTSGATEQIPNTEITRCIILSTGGTMARCGAWLVYNAGTGFVLPLFDTSSAGSQASVTSDGTSITLENTSSNGTIFFRCIAIV